MKSEVCRLNDKRRREPVSKNIFLEARQEAGPEQKEKALSEDY